MQDTQNIFTLTTPSNQETTCTINLLGGGVMDLFLNGKHILYAGPRPDGGTAFSHPCIPNFNIATDLPNHGPARKELWSKINGTTIGWKMAAIPDVYPVGLEVTRKFELEDTALTVQTIIYNSGNHPLPINIAEHNYFACPPKEVKNITINGVLFDKQAQQANAQFNPWQDNNVLEIPCIGKLSFITSGYQAFAQWSQPSASFACIEPIQILPPHPDAFMESAPKLAPRQTKECSYTIKLLEH